MDSIIRGTVQWVRQALVEKSIELPAEVDAARLFEPPPYADEFIELIHRLLGRSDEATCLPVALEVSQFDDLESLNDFPRLQAAAAKGDALAALVKGFIVRSTPISKAALDSLRTELRNSYANPGRNLPNRPNSARQFRLRERG